MRLAYDGKVAVLSVCEMPFSAEMQSSKPFERTREGTLRLQYTESFKAQMTSRACRHVRRPCIS